MVLRVIEFKNYIEATVTPTASLRIGLEDLIKRGTQES